MVWTDIWYMETAAIQVQRHTNTKSLPLLQTAIHVITQGSKYGIARSVSVTKIGNKKNVSKITLKKGKTAQITVKEIKKDKKIRHHRNLCYESSNTAVATVTPEGLIQAVGKGTCTIWVYAQNGVYAALTVTVK